MQSIRHPDRSRLIVSALSALGALALLSGCGLLVDSDDTGPAPATEVSESADTSDDTQLVLPRGEASTDDCLPALWARQDNPDREFDRANDMVEGGSISCATGTTPSEFARLLEDIRTAAAREDREALLREIDMPMLFIDASGERRDLADPVMIEQDFEQIFAPEVLAMMRSITLEDMTVVPDQGAFFALGSIWLVAGEEGGRPRLRTVNRQAVSEAVLSAAGSAPSADDGLASASD